MDELLEKMNEEAGKWGDNGKYILDFLRAHLENHPEDAEKLGAEGKSFSGCMEHLMGVYRKKAVQNVAVASDEEVFAEVRAYYDITGEKSALDISLDDLLGG